MKRFRVLPAAVAALAATGLVLRAVTVHSVGVQPIIYKVIAAGDDLDSVEGLAIPGRLVELWYKQRTFVEGDSYASDGDGFAWCGWKNGGNPVQLGTTIADAGGTFRIARLRDVNTVMLFPSQPDADACRGGVFTQLLVRSCDAPGVNCSAFDAPTLHWLNVDKHSKDVIATASGSVSRADRAAIAVADGPDDGPEPTTVSDVDENYLDTTAVGFTPGQRVTWKCGAGGTAVCPSIVVHDATTVVTPDPEFGYVLGTIQAHRAGGSFFAAAAIGRPEDSLGFQVNVNVKLRGGFDVNLGCDRPQPFDFARTPF